jgi:16S rRNA (cytidine1402-2'-O)-methyltransferase
VVATPIGNLDDLSRRAAETLKQVGRIACEDTRHTAKLLNYYGITTPTISYHEHNERERAADLVSALAAGESIALVTDAGTPLISDPGYRLLEHAAAAGITVVPIPGASAVLAALAGSGLATDEFRFCGFLPPKPGARKAKLTLLTEEDCTLVFFEAPHRIRETLADLRQILGDRRAVAARELTKLHEQFLRGRLSEIEAQLTAVEPKGEFTLVIAKPELVEESWPSERLRAEVARLEGEGVARMEAIKQTARRANLPKRTVYSAVEVE